MLLEKVPLHQKGSQLLNEQLANLFCNNKCSRRDELNARQVNLKMQLVPFYDLHTAMALKCGETISLASVAN